MTRITSILLVAAIALAACSPRLPRMHLIAYCMHSPNVYLDDQGRWWSANDSDTPIAQIAPGTPLRNVCK
jgi:hypothetical protein